MPRMARTPRTSASHGSHASLARILYTLVIFTYCLVSYNRDLKQGRREALRTTTASENTA